MTSLLINPFISFPPSGGVSTLIELGYIEGNMILKSSGSTGMWAAFVGNTTQLWNEGALTDIQTTDAEIGYDFSFSAPAGIKIEKVEVTSSSNHGFIVSENPTDTKISLEGWDGSWNAIGDTGAFTDGGVAVTKTITSTDQVTLFTKFRLLASTTANRLRAIADIKLYEVTAGLFSLNFVDGANITPAISTSAGAGRPEEIGNGVKNPLAADSLLSSTTTSDLVVPVVFDKARVIEKVIVNASSNGGFFSSADPTDAQIDLEGWNGSSWVALGDTGVFTDANSLEKTIISSDQTTLFTKGRILISSATSAARILGELEFFTLI